MLEQVKKFAKMFNIILSDVSTRCSSILAHRCILIRHSLKLKMVNIDPLIPVTTQQKFNILNKNSEQPISDFLFTYCDASVKIEYIGPLIIDTSSHKT